MSTDSPEGQLSRIKRTFRYNKNFAAFWLLLPFLLLVAIFKIWPTIWAPWMATQNYTLVGTTFIGLENFQALLERDSVLQAFRVTAVISFIRIPIAMGFGLAGALAINSVYVKRKSIWRTLYISPIVVAPVIVAIIASLFLGLGGVINQITFNLWEFRIAYLNDPLFAKISVAFAGAYVDIAICFIFFMAGLAGIDYNLYRAAQVDGADRLQQFRHVTIPQLRPILVLVLIFLTNRSLKMFAEPQVLTRGGQPGGETRTVVVLLYQEAFVNLNLGFAAAIGVLLTTLIAGIIVVQYKYLSE